jgi:hypothetical protein
MEEASAQPETFVASAVLGPQSGQDAVFDLICPDIKVAWHNVFSFFSKQKKGCHLRISCQCVDLWSCRERKELYSLGH